MENLSWLLEAPPLTSAWDLNTWWYFPAVPNLTLRGFECESISVSSFLHTLHPVMWPVIVFKHVFFPQQILEMCILLLSSLLLLFFPNCQNTISSKCVCKSFFQINGFSIGGIFSLAVSELMENELCVGNWARRRHSQNTPAFLRWQTDFTRDRWARPQMKKIYQCLSARILTASVY